MRLEEVNLIILASIIREVSIICMASCICSRFVYSVPPTAPTTSVIPTINDSRQLSLNISFNVRTNHTICTCCACSFLYRLVNYVEENILILLVLIS